MFANQNDIVNISNKLLRFIFVIYMVDVAFENGFRSHLSAFVGELHYGLLA